MFRLKSLTIQDVFLVETDVFSDERGFFAEFYHEKVFSDLGLRTRFVQDNMSSSKQGVLRGLHFQRGPAAQTKLVRVIQGKIWDVVVDLRHDSETFGQWVGVELNDQTPQMLWVPGSFAHGFLVLSQTAIVQYKCSTHYDPQAEDSLRWDDPVIGIQWPSQDIILSDKDRQAPLFNPRHTYF